MTFDEWWRSNDGGYAGELSAKAAWESQQQRIDALEAQNKRLNERRDTEYIRMLEWRGIESIESACDKCGGSGVSGYGSTATWRGGIGGQIMTSDICDKCWGSGDKNNIWTNLRKLTGQIKILKQRIAGLEEGIQEHIDRGHDSDCLHYDSRCTCGRDELQALMPGGE